MNVILPLSRRAVSWEQAVRQHINLWFHRLTLLCDWLKFMLQSCFLYLRSLRYFNCSAKQAQCFCKSYQFDSFQPRIYYSISVQLYDRTITLFSLLLICVMLPLLFWIYRDIYWQETTHLTYNLSNIFTFFQHCFINVWLHCSIIFRLVVLSDHQCIGGLKWHKKEWISFLQSHYPIVRPH